MKNKILLCLVVILLIIYISKGSIQEDTSFFNYSLVIKNTVNNTTFEIDMEDYLVGVIAGEMPISFEKEALKAQAVASRTYAYYKSINSRNTYDLTTDNKTQIYLDNESLINKWGINYEANLQKVKEAVQETENEIITYDGNVISAYFFSMSNGQTENGAEVFNENKPYLVSVSSPENNTLTNFQRSKTFSKTEFCKLLNLKDCKKITINKALYNNTHHVTKIIINNKEYKGTEFRKLLNLYSTDFVIDINNDILITCYGHGHDVGMSQYGANIMAKEGYNYQEILKHYYTGVDIEKISV